MQVIFTAIPVLSAAIAITFLHEQPFDALGWVGAAMIVTAGLAIAVSSQQEQSALAAAAAAANSTGPAGDAAAPAEARVDAADEAVSASAARERRG